MFTIVCLLCNKNCEQIGDGNIGEKYIYTETATVGVLKNFAKFTLIHLCKSLFFNKLANLSLQL